jgi:hypothetical protein
MSRGLGYALVLLLALELAVWECFLVPLRVYGVPIPLAAAAAVAGNVLLGRAGARIADRPVGALGPSACWVLVAVSFSLGGPLGDAIVPGNLRGTVFLVAGLVSAVSILGRGGSRLPTGPTPAAPSGR